MKPFSRQALFLITSLIFFFGTGARALALTDDSIQGIWVLPQDQTLIQITVSGQKAAGKILRRPHDRQDEVDKFNPDPHLRGRALIGLPILWELKPKAHGIWNGGVVYDPDSGHTYRAQAHLQNPNTLEFRGYILIPLLGRSAKLKRYVAGTDIANLPSFHNPQE